MSDFHQKYSKNSQGLTAYEVAKKRENQKIIDLFELSEPQKVREDTGEKLEEVKQLTKDESTHNLGQKISIKSAKSTVNTSILQKKSEIEEEKVDYNGKSKTLKLFPKFSNSTEFSNQNMLSHL